MPNIVLIRTGSGVVCDGGTFGLEFGEGHKAADVAEEARWACVSGWAAPRGDIDLKFDGCLPFAMWVVSRFVVRVNEGRKWQPTIFRIGTASVILLVARVANNLSVLNFSYMSYLDGFVSTERGLQRFGVWKDGIMAGFDGSSFFGVVGRSTPSESFPEWWEGRSDMDGVRAQPR